MSLSNREHARLRAVNRMMSRGSGKRIAVVVAGLAAVPLLAGCFNGFDAQTSNQPPSGDGLSTQVGNIQIRSAVWVRNPSNATSFVLSATFVNTGSTPDALTGITTDPKGTVAITGGSIPLASYTESRSGSKSGQNVNLTGAVVPNSGYVQTTFTFANAGAVTGSVMVVPQEGIYASVGPNGGSSASAKPTGSATASPKVTGTPSASASGSPKASASVTASEKPTP
ncbi:MAG: hypothetical protein V9E85_14280 [Candidatus Nanopelagicales bacterium]